MMNKYSLGLLGATVSWGLAFSLVKIGIEHTGLWSFLAVRFGIAALIIAVFFRTRAWDVDLTRFSRAALLGSLLYGHLLLQTLGLELMTASRSAFITATYVPMTPLLAWALSGMRPSKKQWGLVALAFLGLSLLSLPTDPSSLKLWVAQANRGDILTLCSALVGAFHIVLVGRIAQQEKNAIALTFWQFIVVAVLFGMTGKAMLAAGSSSLQAGFDFWNWPQAASVSMLLVALIASFSFVLQIVCQRHVAAVRAAIIYGLKAPFALLFGVAIMGDVMGRNEIIGAFLIFLASVIP